LVAHNPKNYLENALNGIQSNIEVTELICFFDYLKSSDNAKEKATGEYLFDLLKKIIKISLLDGEFKYVERQTLTPIIAQGGSEVSLDKLSSGNLYLIQRLVSLLGQMYSVHLLYGTELTDLCKTEGLLLIDEAENHLHPKWQKTFLNAILSLFPNLQIIVTTHSPFIVSSVKNAKIFVCKSMKDHSIVEDKTEDYANKPVEEILLSPAFETNSFSAEISDLLAQRKLAITEGNKEQAKSIEKLLQEHNPTYFSFFDIDDLLQKIAQQ
jgi:predicted ATP-binding protein involved in virulence